MTTKISQGNIQQTALGNLINTSANRLINPHFAINQWGTNSQTLVNGQNKVYVADRWFAYCAGQVVTADRISGPTPDTFRFRFSGSAGVTNVTIGQRIEAVNSYDLAGTNVTLSALLKSTSNVTVTWTANYATTKDSFGTVATPTKTQFATGTFAVTSTDTVFTANIAVPSAATTGIEILLSVSTLGNGSTWTIGDISLAAGSNSIPDRRMFTQEQMLCYRYAYDLSNKLLGASANPWQPLFFGNYYSSNGGSYILYLPTPMRAIPSLTYSGTIQTNASGNVVSSFGGPYSHVGTLLEGDFVTGGSTSTATTALFRFGNIAAGSRTFFLNAEL